MKEIFKNPINETLICIDEGILYIDKAAHPIIISRDAIRKDLKWSLGGLNIYSISHDCFFADIGNKGKYLPIIEYFNKTRHIPVGRELTMADFQDEAVKETQEFRKRCRVCGEVFCYTMEDLNRNSKLAKSAASDALLGAAQSMFTSQLLGQMSQSSADSKLKQIVDYNHCPKCGSDDLEDFDGSAAPAPAVSAADEILKYKGLLDAGIITQEEFDAKKKQLLGL